MDGSWFHVVSALIGGVCVAVGSSVVNAFVLRPRWCELQQDKCLSKMEVKMAELRKEIIDSRQVSHEVFARKDVVGPQMNDLKREILYVRKRMDQLALMYNLPPIAVSPNSDENGF